MPEGYKNGKPEIEWWFQQITKGIDYRNKVTNHSKWQIWRQFYRADWEDDVLASNLFFKMARSVVPRVYFRDPTISIVATKPGIEHMLFAQLLQRIDNKLIRRMKLKDHMKRMTQNTFFYGTGVGKLGFGAEFAATTSPDGNTEAPNEGSITLDNKIEYNADIMANLPWFQSTPTNTIIVPAGLEMFSNTRWVAHHIRRSLADFKDDPRFKNTSSLSVGAKSKFAGDSNNTPMKFQAIDEMIDLFEVRDKKTGKVFVIAPYVSDQIHLYEDDAFLEYFNNDIPFEFSVFNPDDEYCWGVSDSIQLEADQLDMNETREYIQMHRRMSLLKLLYKKNAITTENIQKLLSGDVMAAVEIEGEPSTDVLVKEMGGIPKDLFLNLDADMVNARETSGFSRNQMGEFRAGSGDTTATEAQIVHQASEIRVDERRDVMADILVNVVNKMHQIIFREWKGDMVEQIMGPTGVPIWVKFRPEMLQGAYEVRVDPDSSVPETRDKREAKALKLYELFAQDPLVNPQKLRQFVLTEMKGVGLDDLFLIQPGAPGTPQNPVDIQQAAAMFQQQQGGQG